MKLLDFFVPKLSTYSNNFETYLPLNELLKLKVFQKKLDYSSYLQSVFSLLEYRNPIIKDTISAIKLHHEFDRIEELQLLLGHAYSQLVEEYTIRPDLITTVSTNHTRLQLRGFSLSEQLALSIDAIKYKKIFLNTHSQQEQAKLNKQERSQTFKPEIEETIDIEIAPKIILLIDDVATTGATLNAHAKVLRQKWKGCTVYALVLCS